MNLANCCENLPEEESEELSLLNNLDGEVQKNQKSTETKSTEEEKPTAKVFLAYLLLVIGVFGACCGMTFSQLLDRSIPHSELNGLRFSIQFIVAVCVVSVRNCDIRVKKELIGWTVLASTGIVGACYAAYGCTYYLPLGISGGLSRSAIAIILSLVTCVTTRVVRVDYIVALIFCVCGTLLILQPSTIFPDTETSLLQNTSAFHSPCHCSYNQSYKNNVSTEICIEDPGERSVQHDHLVGYSLVCADVIGNIICVLVLKHKLKDLSIITFIFWTSLYAVVVSFGLMGVMETPTLPHLNICIGFLVGHMLFSGTHNFLCLYSYQIIAPAMTGLITTLTIPLNFIMQYTVLSGMYPGHANPLEIAGAVLVFVGNLVVPVFENVRLQRTKSA